MHKRIVVCVLAALMLLGAFAACGGTATPTPTPTPSSTGGEGTSTPPGTDREILTITVRADGWATDMEWNLANDKYAQMIKDKFQVIIDPNTAEGEDIIKLLAASNSLPEFFMASFGWDLPLYNSFIDDEVVRSIPFDMINKYPRVKELLDVNGFYVKSIAKIKGLEDGIFSIPKPVAYIEGEKEPFYATGWHGIYYRADWAKALNIAKPETLDQYYNMLKAFTEKDPDGNGKADTYGLSSPGQWALTGIVMPSVFKTAAGGAQWYYDDTAQKWNMSAFDPAMGDMLEWYQKLHNEKILDPEYPLLKWNTCMQKFASNSIGTFGRNMDTDWVYRTIFREIGSALGWTVDEAFENIGTIGTLKKDENDTPVTYATSDIMGGGGTMVRDDVSDEVLDRYLEIHNWLLSEEAKFLSRFGWEGEQYKWNDDKSKVIAFTNPDTGNPYDVANEVSKASSLSAMTTWGMDMSADFRYPAPPPEVAKQRSKELRDEWLKYNIPAPYNAAASLIYLDEQATLAMDSSSQYTLIIQGTKPAKQAFEEWITKMKSQGADTVIELFNQKTTELGIDPFKQGF